MQAWSASWLIPWLAAIVAAAVAFALAARWTRARSDGAPARAPNDVGAPPLDDGPLAALWFDAAPPYRVQDATPSLWRLRGDAPLHRPRLDELLHGDDVRELLRQGGAAPTVARLQRADGGLRPCLVQHRATPDGATHHLHLVDADWLAHAGWHAAEHSAQLQQALERTRAAQRFLQALQHATELLQTCDSELRAAQIVAEGGPELFPGWDGAVTQAGPDGAMKRVAGWGDDAAGVDGCEDECWALRLARLHHVDARRASLGAPRCRHFGAGDLPPALTHTVCVPLQSASEPAAALHLATRRRLDEAEVRAACWGAETLAAALRLALANLRLRQSLREQALRDALTGLFNRRHFDETLAHETSRAARTGDGLTLALLDIDHFKTFNDTFGHEAGDVVLRGVAAQLKTFGRAYDIACRVGGEELAVLMPRAHLAEAQLRLEQLRERIAAMALQHKGVALPPVTVSIGVAGIEQAAPDELLHRADVALYAAKHAGRNRVAVWNGGLETDSFLGSLDALPATVHALSR